MAEDKATVINIDPNGDIILEVSCSDGRIHLLVSSKILSLASPVFSTMFHSRFKEGLGNHPPSGKRLISLPDDNAEAFTILCNAIHYRTDQVPKKPTLVCLENLAVICEKYDCTSALTPWSAMWLHAGIESFAASDLNKLLFVAFVLDDPTAFSRISWEILLAQVGPFVDLPGMTDHDLITSKNILPAFEARKAEINLTLMNAIESPVASLFEDSPCLYTFKVAGQYLQNLRLYQLWPLVKMPQEVNISVIFNRMLSFQDPMTTHCNIMMCRSCQNLNLKEKLLNEKEKISNAKFGLCLDCVKTERQSLREQVCRINHF